MEDRFPAMAKRSKLGRRNPDARRQAILEAGLATFATEGFAAARLDDVAVRAGVAKGTIYLHFKDKQDLFEQIVREAVAPVIARLEGMAGLPDIPSAKVLEMLFDLFRTEVLATRRKDIVRLVLTEGHRFPAIAEFYHREVVSRALRLIRTLLARAHSEGALSTGRLASYPQLVAAPLILAVVWDGLFATIDPLDVEDMLAVHRELILRDPDGEADQ